MGHFQTSLAEIGLLPGKVTRRAEFFERLDRVVPWERWVAIVDARRRVPGGAGRRPVATETTLRMLVAQRCLNLSDEECEFREHAISQAGSVVEHPFHYLKDVTGTRRTRYRGLEKNDQMLCMCFAVANLLMLGRRRVAVA
jgi:hypothetical protein